MKSRSLLILCAAVLAANAAKPADPPPAFAADRFKAHVAYLASDRLEGRGPGTRGEELATDYIAGEFQKAGLKTLGPDGSYFQPVPLVKIATDPKATLQATKGDTALDFACGDDFAGTSQTQTPLEEFDADAVFVGHGITAPEFGWDDYAGTDVKGKVVVLFTNEPPSDDPKFFGGTALTYYGRWTFKFEEAARRGAKACLIIHTPETAGYPYSVVRPLDGAQLERDPNKPVLAFAGWLSRKSGERLLAMAGKTVDAALKEADTKGFKAYSLGANLKGHIPTKVEKFTSNNVAGMVEGSDPALKAEAVVFTAHWDHLGVGRAVVGDAIYNGAADNATGCALVMELARAWAAQTPKPKRSAVFLSVTAEEKGLLGSKYYASHPLLPLGKTALNLNFDMILPLGEMESIVVNGAERTTAWPTVKAVAARHKLDIEPDPRAHLGTYYRSDHFSLARAGVPAFSVAAGTKVKGKPADFARKAMQEFNDKAYHTPQDEVRPDWDFAGFPVLARFAFDVARAVADADGLPTWNPGDEFKPARDKSSVGPGDHTRTLPVGGRTRSYLVHVPKGYDPKTPAPVVLALHGAAMNGPLMAAFCGMNAKADEAGFIAVYPSGTGTGPFLTWNAGGFRGRMAEGQPDDVAFVAALLDDLGGVLAVDSKRVYACGMSNGAMMCYRLAAELSDRIAAVAPVAGTIAIAESKPKRPVPVIHFHGTKDTFVPFELPKGMPQPVMTFKGVEESVRTWVRLNGCGETPKTDTLSKPGDEMAVTRRTYGGGKDGSEVVLVVIDGGGHTWPGQKPPIALIGKSAMNVSANDLIWDFFRKYTRK